MGNAKPLQLILARQLASCVAMPILLVDAEGTLVFFNEPAEALMGRRFDETGEIPAEEWNRVVEVYDEDRRPVPLDDRPMRRALIQREPVSREIWTRSGDEWRHLHIAAFPLVGEGGRMMGVLNLFWEV